MSECGKEQVKIHAFTHQHSYNRRSWFWFVWMDLSFSTYSSITSSLFIEAIICALGAGLASSQPHSVLSDLNQTSAMFPSKSKAPGVSLYTHANSCKPSNALARAHRRIHTHACSEGTGKIQGDSCYINTVNISSGDKHL